MAQHDYNIANAPGATLRADMNALAEAIGSSNAGTSAPSVTFPNMFWYDSTNALLKIRNPGNTAWINVASITGSTLKFDQGGLSLLASGDWFGTSARIPNVDTSGIMEVGGEIQLHPDAAGTEDYRARVKRATGANGQMSVENTGSGGLNLIPGAGGLLVNGSTLDLIPIGVWVPYGGTAAPTKWLLGYGQNVSRTTYALLFAVFGTTYGAGDGSTTFGLPDLRGRVVAGKDDMGGSAANRLQGLSGGVTGVNLGASGGLDYHYLTLAQTPSHTHTGSGSTGTESADHTHTLTSDGNRHGANGTNPAGNFWTAEGDTSDGHPAPSQATGGRSAAHTHAYSFTTSSAGSDSYHNNVQPTIIGNYIIYAGV